MENKENNNGFADTFFTKLKEQSFTIILLVGILYYQNMTFNRELEEYKKIINDKEILILKLTDDERQRLIQRCEYLMEQRDNYVEKLMEMNK